jgi:hypothetical protein
VNRQRIVIDDIHYLDIRNRHYSEKPEHPWQMEYILHWVKRGLKEKLWNLVHEAEIQRAKWSRAIHDGTADFPKGLRSLSDEQMRGEVKLTPHQVAWFRYSSMEPRATADGMFVRAIPGNERGHVSWLLLERDWEDRLKEKVRSEESAEIAQA